MVRFEEMTVGTRRVRGPISDQLDLRDRGGAPHVAIAFAERWRSDPALREGLDPYRDFLELPMAEGVAPLVAARNGVFAYRAPAGRTVRELVGVWSEEGGGGVRAALDLLAECGQVLAGATRAGADRGLRSHGSLDPWRILVDASGKVTLLGYGLPPLDLLEFQRDEARVPAADSLRYCPPERLDGEPEDWTSDLFSVALAAVELATGVPVYDGRPAQILDQAGAGDAVKRLDQIPRELLAVIRTVLAPFPDQRPTDPLIVVDAARKAAAKIQGRTLAELVTGAAPYLSDVEDDLPAGTTVLDVVGPPADEPQRQAAIARAAEAAARATTMVESLAARIDAASPNTRVPEVAAAMGEANAALGAAAAAAVGSDEWADRAVESTDAVQAEAAAAAAEGQLAHVAQAHQVIEEALARASALSEQAAAEERARRQAATEAARSAAARAAAAAASVAVGGEEVEEHAEAARAAVAEAEASGDARVAERAAARAAEAAEAAEAAAVVAAERNRQSIGRVTAAREWLARAETALERMPATDVREATERCRAAVREAVDDPDAVERARVAGEEAVRRAGAAAEHREAIRRRAWIAVARADAARRGGAARAAAEIAEAALDLDEVIDAAMRAEAAADEAEAASKLDVERIGAARTRLVAARDLVATAASQWHPDGVATELADVEDAAASLDVTTLGEDAEAAAVRAEEAAAAAVARARSAIRTLTVVRRRAASTLREAEAESDRPEVAKWLEATRVAVAAAGTTWNPDEADLHAIAAETALAELRAVVEVAARRDAAAGALSEVRAAVEAMAARLGSDALAPARALLAAVGPGSDPVEIDRAVERARLALAEVEAAAADRLAKLEQLERLRERLDACATRLAAVRGAASPDDAAVTDAEAALSEGAAATDPVTAGAAADRAERAVERAEAAALERAERERAIAAERDRARRAAKRAFDLLDQIDSHDVRHVEAARTAAAESERATELGAVSAAAVQAEAALAAVQAAVDRRSVRETELSRKRAEGAERVARRGLPEPPPAELATEAERVGAARDLVEAAADPAEADAALLALEAALDEWQAAWTTWSQARAQAVADARGRADRAVAQSMADAAGRPDLVMLVDQARAAAEAAAATDDPKIAHEQAARAEHLASDVFGRLENDRAVERARERAVGAARRAEEIGVGAGDLIPVAELVLAVLEHVTAADATTDPDVARAAAERADVAAAALADAVARATTERDAAVLASAEACERARRAVDSHPMVDEAPLELARRAHEEAAGATELERVMAASRRAVAAAAQAEASLAAARHADLEGALSSHRDAVAATADQIRGWLALAPALPAAPWLQQVDAVVAEVGATRDPASAERSVVGARELADRVDRAIRGSIADRVRSALSAVEQAAARFESAETELYLEAARLAAIDAEAASDLGRALESVVALEAAAVEAASAAEQGLAAEAEERLAASRARAGSAVERSVAALRDWGGDADDAPGLVEVRAAADEAARATDPAQVSSAADRADERARVWVSRVREAALATPRARAEAAVREAESLAARGDGPAVDKAVSAIRAARAEVDTASNAAAALAAAVRAEWGLPAVREALSGASADRARARAAAAVKKAEAFTEPALAPFVDRVRDAARAADGATTAEGAEAAARRAELALDEAHQAARDLERQASIVTAHLRIAAAAERVAAAGGRVDEVEALAAEADTDEVDRAHDAADRAERLADAAESDARARSASAVLRLAEEARARVARVVAPADAPDEVRAAFEAARAAAERVGADRTGPDAEERATAGLAQVDAAIAAAEGAVARWRRSANQGAVQRAREAVGRVRAAAAEVEGIGPAPGGPSFTRLVAAAEAALEQGVSALSVDDADWSAAQALYLAEVAERLLDELRAQVSEGLALLATLEAWRDDPARAEEYAAAERAARAGDVTLVQLLVRRPTASVVLSPAQTLDPVAMPRPVGRSPTPSMAPSRAPSSRTPPAPPSRPPAAPTAPPQRSLPPVGAPAATPSMAPYRSPVPGPSRLPQSELATVITTRRSTPPPAPSRDSRSPMSVPPARPTPSPPPTPLTPVLTTPRSKPAAGPTLSPADFAALGLGDLDTLDDVDLSPDPPSDETAIEALEAPDEPGGHARDPSLRLVGSLDDDDPDTHNPDAQRTQMFDRSRAVEDDDPTRRG